MAGTIKKSLNPTTVFDIFIYAGYEPNKLWQEFMRAKKSFLVFLLPVIYLLFSSCAGLYLGGGGAFGLGGGETAHYESWSHEDIIFPKLDAGLGYFAEIGTFEKDGTMQAAFSVMPMTGTYGSEKYACTMYQASCGARISMQEDDSPIMFMLPFNLTYQWLNVTDSSYYGGSYGDTTFSGFGANAGLGVMTALGDRFLLNLEALWSFEIYGRADAVNSAGKIEESPFVTGPSFKACLYFML